MAPTTKIFFIMHCLIGISMQQSSTGTCQDNGVCSALWETNGDVTIGIIGNIHSGTIDNNGYKPCSVFQPQDVELIEASVWLFDRIYQADYIPGIRLGVKIYDACDSSDIVAISAVSMMPYFRFSNSTTPKTVQGILGIVTSSQAKTLLNSLLMTNVPLVSPTATAASLADGNSHFFRTIPSDELQMKVMYDFIKSLRMKYIAIVYSDDEFGHQGNKELHKHVDNDGGQVCVAKTINITSLYEAILIVDSLAELQQNLNQKNLPVLFVGQYQDAKGLMAAARTNEQAHRLIWVFPDSVGLDASVFNGYTNLGRNAFSISPYYNQVDSFKMYWTRKLYNTVLSGSLTSQYPPYYREYVEFLLKCSISSGSCNGKTLQDLNDAYTQSSYINTALHSAFALAKAIKNLHTSECGSINGPCPNFDRMLKSTTDQKIIDILRAISVNYTVEESLAFLRPSLANSPGFSFESNGNLGSGNNQDIYLFHNAKCQTSCKFQIVGMATRNTININFDNITLFLDRSSDSATLGSELPSIYCVRNCQVCEKKYKSDINYASIWGENLIVAFSPVHKPGSAAFSCGDMRDRQTIEDVEALLYGIETFNNNSGSWTGTPLLSGHLGIIIFDSCQNPLFAANVLSQWLSGSLKIYDRGGRLFDPRTCIGIIGGLYSTTNLQIIHISRKEFLVQIGFASSSLELPLNSPEFLRTIPADDIQAQAMVNLVKRIGFNAFSVIHTDDSYGSNGYEQLVLRADEAKLCINKVIPIPRNVKEQQLADVFAALQDAEETKVVIVFSGADEGNVILKTANKKTIGKKFIWIGSEAWGRRDSLIDAESGDEALGTIVVDFQQSNQVNYSRYMTTLKPTTNTRNKFFNEWWEKEFDCVLPSASIPNPPNKCDELLAISTPLDTQTAIFALKAVWTMALGLSSAFEKICGRGDPLTCATRIRNQKDRDTIAKEIRETKLIENGQEYRVYTNRGDGGLAEELYNVQHINGVREFVKVAEYSQSGLRLSNSTSIKFYDTNGQEMSQPLSTCIECNCIYKYPDDPMIMLNSNITVEGQVYIVAFLPFHHSVNAKQIDHNTVALAESLKESLKIANAKTFGHDVLGLLIYDTYADKNMAALQTSLVMETGRYFRLKHYNTNANDLVCLITYGTGIDGKYVGSMLNKDILFLNFGLITSQATHRKYFYNFGILLEQELEALLAAIQYFQWTYLTIVYSDTEESNFAKEEFIELAKLQDVCAIESYTVSSFIASIQYQKMHSSVVVLFVESMDVTSILNTVGDRLGKYVFLSWSKLTNTLSLIKENVYRSVLNNIIGVSLHRESSNPTDSDLIQVLKSKKMNQHSNPWWENDDDFKKAVDNVQNEINQMNTAVQGFSGALHDLMLAECGTIELCSGLLSKPDWKTQRLIVFLERNTAFSKGVLSLKRLSIQAYSLDANGFWFNREQMGLFDPDTSEVSITNATISSVFKEIKSSCTTKDCKMCNAEGMALSFPGWAVFLIILILLLIAIIIGLIVYIVRMNWGHQEKNRIADEPDHIVDQPKNLMLSPMDDVNSTYLEPKREMDMAEYYVLNPQTCSDSESRGQTNNDHYRMSFCPDDLDITCSNGESKAPQKKGSLNYDYAQNTGDWHKGGNPVVPLCNDEINCERISIKKYNVTPDANSIRSGSLEGDFDDTQKSKHQHEVEDVGHAASPMNAIWMYEAGISPPIVLDDIVNTEHKETTNPAYREIADLNGPYRMSFCSDDFGINPNQCQNNSSFSNSVSGDQLKKDIDDKPYYTSNVHTSACTDNNLEHPMTSRKSSFVNKFEDNSNCSEGEEEENKNCYDDNDDIDDDSDHTSNAERKSYNICIPDNSTVSRYNPIDEQAKHILHVESKNKDFPSYIDDTDVYSMSLSENDIVSSESQEAMPVILLEDGENISDKSVDV